MEKLTPLEPGKVYHIYNRGNNGENIFVEARNYLYFLKLYTKHIEPVADTFAYCLLRNHFHLLVRIKTSRVSREANPAGRVELDAHTVGQQFNNWFNSYAKSINQAYSRTGSLFQKRFGRIEVASDRYFLTLINYIHRNPQTHNFVDDFRTYPYSSYQTLLSDQPTRLSRIEVLEWFSGPAHFREFHQTAADTQPIAALVADDVV